ncbi:MAG: cyclic peptide export ABC transporter [Dactylosporangium sp.]|nr:cyclic peptide export ABC transporter [Dactylosporangium sp.]NNJ61940.1 cyclic peptide export ABC transporter [Dactylosporangium sp.]
MGLFKYLLRSSRGTFALAIVAGAISGGTGAAFISIVNMALRQGTDTRGSLVWVYAGLCLATVTTRILSQVLLYRLSQGVIYQLRRSLIDRVLGAPLRGVEETGTPRLYSALSDDVVVIGNALPGLPAICSSAAFVVVALVYLATISPVVAVATLATAAVGVAIYRLFARYGIRSLEAARRDQDTLFEYFRAVTDGIKELKLNRQRRQVLAGQELDAVAGSFQRRSVLGLSIFEGATGSGQATFFGFIGLVLFVVPAYVAIPAQTLAACVLVLLFTVASLQGVLVWLPALGRASVALGKIEERLELLESEEQEDQPGAPPGFEDWKLIEFRGVSHVYPGPAGEEFVLGPVDFEVRRGEVLFVVGANGSGKTTLAKVLTSLYVPEAGVVRVDGRKVDGQNRDAYRQLFSAVFSDFFVFDSLLGLPTENRAAKARRYLARLQLDHKVAIVGDRFSTTALSQGQRKRLALLATYLEDRSCYVFDEWAADQDPLFKEFFYDELLTELKARNKAVVVISHDDRYFHVADRLIRFDYGQIRPEEVLGGQAAACRSTG